MARRIISVAAATGGVWLLAGPGWALLVLSVLVWVAWPQPVESARLQVVVRRVRLRAAAAGKTAREAPRRALAGWSMGGGLAAFPVGAGVLGGPGWALMAIAGACVGLGLLVGWNS